MSADIWGASESLGKGSFGRCKLIILIVLLLLLRVNVYRIYGNKYGEGSILDLLASGLKSTLQNRKHVESIESVESVERVESVESVQGMQGLEGGSRVNSAAEEK